MQTLVNSLKPRDPMTWNEHGKRFSSETHESDTFTGLSGVFT